MILYLTEQVYELPYLIKTLIKVPLFVVIPIVSVLTLENHSLKIKYANVVIQALGVFSIVMIAFYLFSKWIDFDTIRNDFSQRLEINKTMFVWASIYTIFINAFIEELFFRAYVFGRLRKQNKVLAYVFSSLLFAIYHLTIFMTWFNLPILLLILLGLFLGGMIFSYNFDKHNSIVAAFIVHVAADVAVVVIGYMVIFNA